MADAAPRAVWLCSCLVFGCTAETADTGPESTGDTASDTGNDSGDSAVDTGPDLLFTHASGTEQYQRALWLEEAGQRDCDMWWNITADGVAPCDGCEFAMTAQLVLDEERSFDDGACATIHMDKSQTLAYTDAWEDAGPSVLVQVEGLWFWWAYAERTENGVHWWFGVKDIQVSIEDGAPNGHDMDYATSYWDSVIAFE